MNIITDSNNIIIYISETIDFQEETGYLLINNNTIAVPQDLYTYIYRDIEVPSKVTAQKYCYTEEQGFYINEDYVEFPGTVEQQLEEAKEQITNLELALAELYDLIESK